MLDDNKHNLLYFQNPSMRGLYECMEQWQKDNKKRLLSVSILQDGGEYCCIALTNPTEVVIVSPYGTNSPANCENGGLHVWAHPAR